VINQTNTKLWRMMKTCSQSLRKNSVKEKVVSYLKRSLSFNCSQTRGWYLATSHRGVTTKQYWFWANQMECSESTTWTHCNQSIASRSQLTRLIVLQLIYKVIGLLLDQRSKVSCLFGNGRVRLMS
jgi:hypothetical protein